MYYFVEQCNSGDQFTAIIKYKFNPNISFDIIEKTGTFTKIKIRYKASLEIRNVSMIIDLSGDYIYNDAWNYNATQNSNNLKLVIPFINFTTSYQTIYVEGYSSIPYATISGFESDQNYNRLAVDTEIDFAGFLDYPKYTNSFELIIDEDWTCYNVYYGNETYGINRISNTIIYVKGDGFDPRVNDSFVHFTTKPFTTVDWDYKNDIITIIIVSEMDVDYVDFLYRFDPEGVHALAIQSITNNFVIYNLSDSEHDGYLTFHSFHINSGRTVITIRVNFSTPFEMFAQMILPIVICAAGIGLWFFLKHNEKFVNKLKEMVVKSSLYKKIEEKTSGQKLDNLTVKIEEGKVTIEKKK